HWVGKRKLAADTNASRLMTVWNMPESSRLEAQTLDKLSTAPWRILQNTASNSASALLRPLLEDVLEEEWYLETVERRDGRLETVGAIRLNSSASAVWEKNMASVLESLTGIRARKSGSQTGWLLKKHDFPTQIEFRRIGDWTLL